MQSDAFKAQKENAPVGGRYVKSLFSGNSV